MVGLLHHAWAIYSLFLVTAQAVTIAEINGNKFMSPYATEFVRGVTGIVTAKKKQDGFFMRSTTADDDQATSESIFVYGSRVTATLKVGDEISLTARVGEYRRKSSEIYGTELGSPTNVKILSRNNKVEPLIIGVNTTHPPTEEFSSLDNGDVYGYPNGQSRISLANPVLEPTKYGMDFWESLNGELVTIRGVTILSRPSTWGEMFVVGNYPVTGRSERGMLTESARDANPEALLAGAALDGTLNPTTFNVGDKVEDITGVILQQYGYYFILPTTAIKLATPAEAVTPVTSLTSSRDCKGLTVANYNLRNLKPTGSRFNALAKHIVESLKAPDILFVQEIQDNSGGTNDGVVDADVTLGKLTDAIKTLGDVEYSFAEVPPVDNADGGEPGANIRVAYLYRPDAVSLYKPKQGKSTEATKAVAGTEGVELTLNPGRVDPTNPAFTRTRKPLVAAWKAVGATKPFFTINNHWNSKGGSTSMHGDWRTPINGHIKGRIPEAQVTAKFVADLLKLDSEAAVIAGGDFNEYPYVEPLLQFAKISGLSELAEVAGVPKEERYTYAYNMNHQAIDSLYVSPSLASSAEVEFIHLNTWVSSKDAQSDHDPITSRFNVCGAAAA